MRQLVTIAMVLLCLEAVPGARQVERADGIWRLESDARTRFPTPSYGTAHSSFHGDIPVDAPERPGGPRVRPNDKRAAALLREGLQRSSTLRALVNDVERHDVIVYVEMQPGIQQELSGCVTWMSQSGSYRYVRASLNPDLSRAQLIAALAHELRHVLEIAEQPSVADAQTLAALYQQIGYPRRPGSVEWETKAARDVGHVVRRELTESAVAMGDADTVGHLATKPQRLRSSTR